MDSTTTVKDETVVRHHDGHGMEARGFPVVALLGLYLLAILFLNCTFRFCSDDCSFGLCGAIGPDGIPPHLAAIPNAWRWTLNDGYRPIAHFIGRIFTGCFDKWVFNLANTAMMGCLVVCAFRLARRSFNFGFETMALLVSLVFFILCKGESYLWCAGSVNYLWAGTGSLVFCIVAERMERVDATWPEVAWYCLLALIAGWLQESFSLPILCAMCAYHVLHRKSFNAKKAIVLLSYLAGTLLLVRVAGRRTSTIPPFTLSEFAMTLIKIAVAVKGVWVLLAVLLVRKDRMAIVRRNAFPLLVVMASICMIAIVGFNGERCLWAANLFAIIVIVRECRPSRRIAYALSVALAATLCVCCILGFRIGREFDVFTEHYLASEQGLCWHERVRCGPFARFFHQFMYGWNDTWHGKVYARFHGREVAPIAFRKEDYDALLSDTFCIPSNRLATVIEAYTTPRSNAIVVPWPDDLPAPDRVRVEYDFPKGFIARLGREIAIRRDPPVANAEIPRTVVINGRRLTLVGKLPRSDEYIRGIAFLSL